MMQMGKPRTRQLYIYLTLGIVDSGKRTIIILCKQNQLGENGLGDNWFIPTKFIFRFLFNLPREDKHLDS